MSTDATPTDGARDQGAGVGSREWLEDHGWFVIDVPGYGQRQFRVNNTNVDVMCDCGEHFDWPETEICDGCGEVYFPSVPEQFAVDQLTTLTPEDHDD